MPTYILGISCYYHDSAAALIKDGEIVAAVQEERFTRKKHDASFPANSIKYCLEHSSIGLKDIKAIVYYEKPLLKFDRLIETYLAFAPYGLKSFITSLPVWVKEKLYLKRNILKELCKVDTLTKSVLADKLKFAEHHQSHAASAFYPSRFDKAAILTIDGVGEWSTTTISLGNSKGIRLLEEINYPHSLGLLYSAFTYYCGFKVNSGEYKLMGLAPYGEPIYTELILENIVKFRDDGSFHMDMSYFNYNVGLTMTSAKFHQLFGREPRKPESQLDEFHMNVAASIQKVTEIAVVNLAKRAKELTGLDSICLAGGVALNCVANGKLHKEKIFNNIWIQPAAGDAGCSLGAALAYYYESDSIERQSISGVDHMKGSYLGPSFEREEILAQLQELNARFSELSYNEMLDVTAISLDKGLAVGWMNGRMEFGPRSLGARSILADPRSKETQRALNLKVKYRESFRPFAPSVLSEKVEDWFDLDQESPYMLLVKEVNSNRQIAMTEQQKALFGIDKLNIVRSEIPAVTHVDYSARVQTVHKETNKEYHDLISRFNELTGCPVLVNTSFNVRGEPIVCSPKDAYNCFMGTELDLLVIGNFVLHKKDQPSINKTDYLTKYELD